MSSKNTPWRCLLVEFGSKQKLRSARERQFRTETAQPSPQEPTPLVPSREPRELRILRERLEKINIDRREAIRENEEAKRLLNEARAAGVTGTELNRLIELRKRTGGSRDNLGDRAGKARRKVQDANKAFLKSEQRGITFREAEREIIQTKREIQKKREERRSETQTASVGVSLRGATPKTITGNGEQLGLLAGGQQARIVTGRSGKTIIVQQGAAGTARQTFERLGGTTPQKFTLFIDEPDGTPVSSITRTRKEVTARTEAEAKFAGLPGAGTFQRDTFTTAVFDPLDKSDPDFVGPVVQQFSATTPLSSTFFHPSGVIRPDPAKGSLRHLLIFSDKQISTKLRGGDRDREPFGVVVGEKISSGGSKLQSFVEKRSKREGGFFGRDTDIVFTEQGVPLTPDPGVGALIETSKFIQRGGGFISGFTGAPTKKPVTTGLIVGSGGLFGAGGVALSATGSTGTAITTTVGVGLGTAFVGTVAIEAASQDTPTGQGFVVGERSFQAAAFGFGASQGANLARPFTPGIGRVSTSIKSGVGQKVSRVDTAFSRPPKGTIFPTSRAGKVGGRGARSRAGRTTRGQQRAQTFGQRKQPKASELQPTPKSQRVTKGEPSITLKFQRGKPGKKAEIVKDVFFKETKTQKPPKSKPVSSVGFKVKVEGPKAKESLIVFPTRGFKPSIIQKGKQTVKPFSPAPKPSTPPKRGKGAPITPLLAPPEQILKPSQINMFGNIESSVPKGGLAQKQLGFKPRKGKGFGPKDQAEAPFVEPPVTEGKSRTIEEFRRGSPEDRAQRARAKLRDLASRRESELTRIRDLERRTIHRDIEIIGRRDIEGVGRRDLTSTELGKDTALLPDTGVKTDLSLESDLGIGSDFRVAARLDLGSGTSVGTGRRSGQEFSFAQDTSFDSAQELVSVSVEPTITVPDRGRGRGFGGGGGFGGGTPPPDPFRPGGDPFRPRPPDEPPPPDVPPPAKLFGFGFEGQPIRGGGLPVGGVSVPSRVSRTLFGIESGLGGGEALTAVGGFTGLELLRTKPRKRKKKKTRSAKRKRGKK